MSVEVATATPPEPPKCCEQNPPTNSRFWRGFLCGLPIYPLVIPWILFTMPERFTEVYIRTYVEYVRFVMRVLGVI